MFGLVDEGVGNKYVVGAPAALGEGSLKGVGYIGILHKLHEAGVEDSCEKLAKAAGDGNWAVIDRVILGAFFVEGGNVGFLPWGGEVGCAVYVVEEVGEEGQAYWARSF